MKVFAAGLGLATAVLIAVPAAAGPFGVDFATATPESLGCSPSRRPNMFLCDKMPDQSWAMGDYQLIFSKTGQLCTIVGTSQAIKTGPDGTALRAAMEAFKDQLMQTYGAPKLSDGSYSGSALPDTGNWMGQLMEMERQFSYGWTFDPPREGISDMALAATGYAEDDGRYELQVNAPNALACFMGAAPAS